MKLVERFCCCVACTLRHCGFNPPIVGPGRIGSKAIEGATEVFLETKTVVPRIGVALNHGVHAAALAVPASNCLSGVSDATSIPSQVIGSGYFHWLRQRHKCCNSPIGCQPWCFYCAGTACHRHAHRRCRQRGTGRSRANAHRGCVEIAQSGAIAKFHRHCQNICAGNGPAHHVQRAVPR